MFNFFRKNPTDDVEKYLRLLDSIEYSSKRIEDCKALIEALRELDDDQRHNPIYRKSISDNIKNEIAYLHDLIVNLIDSKNTKIREINIIEPTLDGRDISTVLMDIHQKRLRLKDNYENGFLDKNEFNLELKRMKNNEVLLEMLLEEIIDGLYGRKNDSGNFWRRYRRS